ncbi:hypothetical protein BFW01_g9705 [Lasiodiplodia theobromae]|uniref:Uncharacterized protein n=1 Tax=Lasiodiplodia theobromae TaxID=45133 RepID=A0A5N5DI72_9PEZI|nr:uncharacterized protein LTHEOB_2522 [Lasiodiplodia theobromae]KAB2577535.1 hypothetical protein DBV05_g3811 [Lasiodiplodia theobromae]KAF4535530.1 hypothetical protein LTHEOB_2522 [Lasiodiplodia theobromae]KAF9638808.1 hypothetical protein BFW01_g9705 [Lasiodiplodia theobromae]
MADGLNDARAIRIAEIMTDFRNLQHYIAQIRVSPSPEEFYLEGYTLVRQCHAEAQAVLNAPFNANPSPGEDVEQQKVLLKAVLLDASLRRFRCQRIYLRATAAMRWINSRNAILRGESADPAGLQNVDASLQSELANITDEYVEYSLRAQDLQQGKWLNEDPELAIMQQYLF